MFTTANSRIVEKSSLLPRFSPPNRSSSHPKLNLGYMLTFVAAAALISASVLYMKHVYPISILNLDAMVASSLNLCQQADVLVPRENHDLWTTIGKTIGTEGFKAHAISWLSGAVQVETETYDDMGPVGEDPRWENRLLFHKYLEKTFPLVHSTLQLEKANTYGLLYTWQGSDASLKPVLLMAHYDVVPVNPDTISEWTYPPYSGYFDGEFIWGRGSSDDKSGLIGTIGAIETLLGQGFQPTRTFVAAFGFDEEAGGLHGAKELGARVLEKYGEDSFAFIIDEGGGFSEQFGTIFATPGVAEKGSLNVEISVATQGGHSSVPPSHTGIGILSALIVHLENHPYEAHIDRKTSSYQLFQCFAEYGATIPSDLRDAIKHSARSDKALRHAEKTLFEDKLFKSLVGTTQAVDIIHGGIKVNALPEQAWAVVNHRIATTSSLNATMQHDADLFLPLAKEFNLTFSAFGETLSTPKSGESKGSLKLTANRGLEPAPVTPTKDSSAPYQLLSGTIKATYNSHRALKGDNIAVGPGVPTGNTDTRHFWPLSEHIFRYKHQNGGTSNNTLSSGAHTVNEFLSAESLLETIRFFVTLILNADESSEI